MIMTTEYKNINAPPYSPDILDIYIYTDQDEFKNINKWYIYLGKKKQQKTR